MKKPPLDYPVTEEIKAQFFALVGQKQAADDCWIWPKCTPEGYPYFSWKLVQYSAAQVSHLIHLGPIPSDQKVLRLCGKRSCVNPQHLALGKPNQNTPLRLEDWLERMTERENGLRYELTMPCLVCKSAARRDGYGVICIDGKRRPATHVVWERHHGKPVPKGMVIRHHCDNKSCVEITHLALGTTQDNVDDRDRRGRAAQGDRHWTKQNPANVPKGETHGMSILTEYEVVLIRRTFDALGKGSIGRICRYLQLKRYAVWSVAHRKTWHHLPEDAHPDINPLTIEELAQFAPVYPTGDGHKLTKLSDQQVREIRYLAKQNPGKKGLARVLAERYGVSRRLIQAIITRQKRSQVEDHFESLPPLPPLE
jgi:hypothetical protein